jgi:FkbM family methyltransferase
MIKSFKKTHPWLIKTLKKKYWSLIIERGNHSFIYYLDNLDYYLKLNSKDESLSKPIFLGDYETGTCRFVQKILSGGEVVFDIGANIGFYTILFSRLVGDTGKIHAFEPSLREFLNLCENVSRNQVNNVYLNQVGISDQNTYAMMNVMKDERFGAYNTFGRVNHYYVRNAEVNPETVRLTTLDNYCEDYSLNSPDLIKIDVEGLEKKVFEGGRLMLERDNAPLIIFELFEQVLEGANSSSEEICRLLSEHRYSIYDLDDHGNLSQYKKGISRNVVALKENHFPRVRDAGVEFVA